MRQACHAESALQAEGLLTELAAELDKTHPGAAASLREGMAETLTILRLGVPPTLARTLRSANPHRVHNRDLPGALQERQAMAGRDYGAALVRRRDARSRSQFRRVNGHLHLPRLRAALDASFTENVSTDCPDETVNAA